MPTIGTYQGQPITGGTDAEVQAQVAKINAQGTQPQSVTPISTSASPTTGPIPVSTLTGTTPTPATVTQPAPSTGLAGLQGNINAGQDAFTQSVNAKAEKDKQNYTNSSTDFSNFLLGKDTTSGLTNTAYSSTVDPAQKELQDITNQINAEKVSARHQIEALQNNPQGLYGQGLQDKIDNINRQSLSKQADLSVIQLAKQGAYDSAKTVADRAIASIIEKETNRQAALKATMDTNKDLFTKSEQRQFDLMLADRKSASDAKANDLKFLSDLSIESLKNGGSVQQALNIRNATSIADAIKQSGLYSDPISQGASQEDLAYAAQYASTGTIPTGVKGAQFGRIAALAKQLPKSDGTIVDKNTGIKSSTVPAAVSDDFTRLQNIVKNTARLKQLNNLRSQGLVGGSLSAIFGTKQEAEYDAVVKSIVDDISRMQSGAALTPSEVQFYKDYLPGHFSQALFLGQNSDSKIDNFAKIMTDRLQTGLDTNGLVSYGFTKIKGSDGNEYTVGQKIKSASGIEGTVLSDGTISVPDNQVSGDGKVSINIPSGTLASVNNNPGNLRFVGQSGATQGKGGFALFSTPQAGAQALKNQIALDVSRGHTLLSFINKYAPPSENNTSQYVQQVAAETGISPNKRLTNADVDALTRAIAKKESSSVIA